MKMKKGAIEIVDEKGWTTTSTYGNRTITKSVYKNYYTLYKNSCENQFHHPGPAHELIPTVLVLSHYRSYQCTGPFSLQIISMFLHLSTLFTPSTCPIRD